MVDVVDTATRSRMMAGIKGKNTKPERLVRSLLHRQGFRFRLNVCELPGKPDIVLPRYHAVIFVIPKILNASQIFRAYLLSA